MITELNHIVYVRYPKVLNMVPGTIYICSPEHTAFWLCPCGCGQVFKTYIAKCKVFEPYDRYSVPDGHTGYEISEDGEISFPLSPSSNRLLDPFHHLEYSVPKFQFRHRISVCRTQEECMMQSTCAVEFMCDKIAKELLSARIIRPVILKEDCPDGFALEIGCSLYAVADPSYDRYPNLVFFETPRTRK